MNGRYKNPDNDPRGVWLLSDLAARNYYSLGSYPITTPSGRLIEGPPPGNYWRVSRAKFDELERDGRIWWGKNGSNRPGVKRFLTEVRDGVVPQTLWQWKDVGSTRNSKQELNGILGHVSEDIFFGTPKPSKLMERVLRIAMRPGDIALDFFAGSGTFAHALAKINAEDGGNRKFILVSNTEATDEHPDKNLCRDVCAERVRRVIGGYTNAKGEAVPGLGGNFAYLRATRVPRHRLERRLGHAEIWNALQLIHGLPLQPAQGTALKTHEGDAMALAYLPEWREAAVSALRAWCTARPQPSIVVYSWTPDRLHDLLDGIDLRPIPESLRLRFGRTRA